DLHVAEIDVADAERNEFPAARARVRRRRRREILRGPRPQPSAPGEEVLGPLGRPAARARVLRGERHASAFRAPAADQLWLVGGPREDVLRHRHLGHRVLRSACARNWSFTTLPVAFTGSSSRNSTTRGTL